jgi:hypothetical protein
MDFGEVGYKHGKWTEMAQDRVKWQNLVLNFLKFCYYCVRNIALPYGIIFIMPDIQLFII